MSISEDFRCLSNKDPGTWLPIPRLVVLAVPFVLVVVILGLVLVAPKLGELDAAKQEEERLKTEFISSKQAAVSLESHRRQLEEIDKSFGTLLKQLPDKTEVESLLAEVNQSGLGQGLQFDLFKPAGTVNRDFYVEVPIDVRVNGSYHEFGAFAADIAKLPRIVTLNEINVAPGQGDGRLSMTMRLKTFHYLDEAEGGNKK